MAKLTYRNIQIRGVTYPDAKSAAVALGVTPGRVREARRLGQLEGLGRGSNGRSVTIRGVIYPSHSAAGRALAVNANTVRAAQRNGTLHRVGTGRVGPEPMRVLIAGVEFADARAAAAHYGVQVNTVLSAVCDGDPDRIARPRRYNPARSQPITIGGLSFPSKSAASRALGFKDREFVAKALKQGSKKGRERILAAAMKLTNERESNSRSTVNA